MARRGVKDVGQPPGGGTAAQDSAQEFLQPWSLAPGGVAGHPGKLGLRKKTLVPGPSCWNFLAKGQVTIQLQMS